MPYDESLLAASSYEECVRLLRKWAQEDSIHAPNIKPALLQTIAANWIGAQAVEITAKQRIIDAQAGIIADLQERLRAETSELRAQLLSDQGQYIEATWSLRYQIAQMVDLKKMMRWVEEDLFIGPYQVATAYNRFGANFQLKDNKWRGLLYYEDANFIGPFETEAEARSATESAVLEVLRSPDNTPGDGDKTMGDA